MGLGPNGCSPTGLAVGASGNLMVGYGNVGAAAILLNPKAGSIGREKIALGDTEAATIFSIEIHVRFA